MTPNDTIIKRLWRIAEPVCTSAGYELIDIVLTQSAGWVLRVFIDHPQGNGGPVDGGSAIGFGDCERVSHELSAALDVEDPIDHAYNLEVSSPGLDRPLRTPAHFRRYLGHEVRVRLRTGLGGRRNFKGTLMAFNAGTEPEIPVTSEDAQDDSLVVSAATITMTVDGIEYQLPFNDIENARLVPAWDALFQRGPQR